MTKSNSLFNESSISECDICDERKLVKIYSIPQYLICICEDCNYNYSPKFIIDYYYQKKGKVFIKKEKELGTLDLAIKQSRPKKIYFAHSYHLKDQPIEKEMIEKLSKFGEVLNPFDNEGKLEEKYGGKYYDNPTKEFALDIINSDFKVIRNSDYVVAYIKERQIGTFMEIAYCLFMLQKPIHVICDVPSPFFLGFPLISWFPSLEAYYEKMETVENL